jgi:hypothetical protein
VLRQVQLHARTEDVILQRIYEKTRGSPGSFFYPYRIRLPRQPYSFSLRFLG